MNGLNNNKMGFQTKVWGPAAWLFLHTVTLNYNPEKSKEYRLFFKYLKDVLPCGACRDNYTRILKIMPMDKEVMKTRSNLSYWLFKVHNRVQNDIYKKTEDVENKPKYENNKKDFKQIVNFYETFRAKCNKSSYGCYIPSKGNTKQMAKINIIPFKGKRQKDSIRILK